MPREDVGMSISEAMTKRRRRAFSPEFKSEVVDLCRQPGRSVASVCEGVGANGDGGAPLGPPG